MAPHESITWEALLDRFKYDPDRLFDLIEADESSSSAVKESIESASNLYSSWPVELQNWRLIFASLLATSIGMIASPYESKRAYSQLLVWLQKYGLGALQLRMISGEISSLYKTLKDSLLVVANDRQIEQNIG